MSSATPAPPPPSAPEVVSAAGLFFADYAATKRWLARRGEQQENEDRKTHKLVPCRFQPERAEPRDHGRKNQPDSANEVCQESCISRLPSQKCQRVRGSSKRRCSARTRRLRKITARPKNTGHRADRQPPDPGDPLQSLRKLPSGTAQLERVRGVVRARGVSFRRWRPKRAAPNPDRPGRIPFVAEKNAKRIDFQQVSGGMGVAPGQEPLDVFWISPATECPNIPLERGHDPSSKRNLRTAQYATSP